MNGKKLGETSQKNTTNEERKQAKKASKRRESYLFKKERRRSSSTGQTNHKTRATLSLFPTQINTHFTVLPLPFHRSAPRI